MRIRTLFSLVCGAIACSAMASADAPPPSAPPAVTPPASTPAQLPPKDAPFADPDAASKKYPDLVAVIETSRGTMRATLGVNQVPKLVAHFANLAERGFYDGLSFHSVAAQTQIHSGDPTGTGDGGCGYSLPKQFDKRLLYEQEGVLGLWTTGPSVGSQFFITLVPQARKYNLTMPGLGKLTEGLDVAKAIRKGDSVTKVRIEGDHTKLFEDLASEIKLWNAKLDALPARAAPQEPTKPAERPAVPR